MRQQPDQGRDRHQGGGGIAIGSQAEQAAEATADSGIIEHRHQRQGKHLHRQIADFGDRGAPHTRRYKGQHQQHQLQQRRQQKGQQRGAAAVLQLQLHCAGVPVAGKVLDHRLLLRLRRAFLLRLVGLFLLAGQCEVPDLLLPRAAQLLLRVNILGRRRIRHILHPHQFLQRELIRQLLRLRWFRLRRRLLRRHRDRLRRAHHRHHLRCLLLH